MHTHLAGLEPIHGITKLGSNKGSDPLWSLYISVKNYKARVTILRTKIPEAVWYKDRVWSLMTRRVLLTNYSKFFFKKI